MVLLGPSLISTRRPAELGEKGQPAEVLLYYHGQQCAHCEEEIKELLITQGCIRVAAYLSLDNSPQCSHPMTVAVTV